MSPLPLPSGVFQLPVSLTITFTPHPLQASGAAMAFLSLSKTFTRLRLILHLIRPGFARHELTKPYSSLSFSSCASRRVRTLSSLSSKKMFLRSFSSV